MKNARIVACLALGFSACARILSAQAEFVRQDYFPAEMEFVELLAVSRDFSVNAAADKTSNPEAALYREVGFERRALRAYETRPAGGLSIETVTLQDARAAYSLLTLLGTAAIRPGPPGDFLSESDSEVSFSRGNVWVRIRSGVPGDLALRVARSVGNRIGRSEDAPILISRFPPPGQNPGTVRYMLGPLAISRFAPSLAGTGIEQDEGLEVARSGYALDGGEGFLSLLDFPTVQLADSRLESMSPILLARSRPGERVYIRRAGPVLAILEGTFDSPSADKILGALDFTYSVRWIFDRSRSDAGFLGDSMGILGTVVESLVFTALLCFLSALAGVIFGFSRLLLRGYAPNNFLDRPERTELIRLKIHEN